MKSYLLEWLLAVGYASALVGFSLVATWMLRADKRARARERAEGR